MKYISIIKDKGIKYFIHAAFCLLRKIIFQKYIHLVYRINYKKIEASYSQNYEDLFIDYLLKFKGNGSYIDIGANHPSVFNNTKRFYDRGWRGVNIEPNKKNFELFLNKRVADISMNIGIGPKSSSMYFYIFESDTLCTFSKQKADELISAGFKLIETKIIEIKPLSEIFKFLNKNKVDFISIDTEGFDLEVLKSNDWEKYRAAIICIEDESGRKYDKYLKKYGYKKIWFNGLNSFFKDTKHEKN